MTAKKRLFSLFLSLCMVLGMMPVSAFAQEPAAPNGSAAASTTIPAAEPADEGEPTEVDPAEAVEPTPMAEPAGEARAAGQTIEKIEIVNVSTGLVIGKLPAFTGKVADADGDKYELYREEWYSYGNGDRYTSDPAVNAQLEAEGRLLTALESGDYYYYRAHIRAKEGYVFSKEDGFNSTLNGEKVYSPVVDYNDQLDDITSADITVRLVGGRPEAYARIENIHLVGDGVWPAVPGNAPTFAQVAEADQGKYKITGQRWEESSGSKYITDDESINAQIPEEQKLTKFEYEKQYRYYASFEANMEEGYVIGVDNWRGKVYLNDEAKSVQSVKDAVKVDGVDNGYSSITLNPYLSEWIKFDTINIGDVRMTPENMGDILGDGTARYDMATKTLTLENANIKAYHRGLYSQVEGLTLELIGSNTITAVPNNYSPPYGAAQFHGNTTIAGSGSLAAKGFPYGIDAVETSWWDGTTTVYSVAIQEGVAMEFSCTPNEDYPNTGAMTVKPDLSGCPAACVVAGDSAETAAEVTDPANTDYHTGKYLYIGPRESGEHDHTWSAGYKMNQERHWKYCTHFFCTAAAQEAAHQIAEGKCTVCGAETVGLNLHWDGTKVVWQADKGVRAQNGSVKITLTLYKRGGFDNTEVDVKSVTKPLDGSFIPGEVDFADKMTETGVYFVQASVETEGVSDTFGYIFTGYQEISDHNVYAGYRTVTEVKLEDAAIHETVKIGQAPVFTAKAAQADQYEVYLETWVGSDGKSLTSEDYFNSLSKPEELITTFEEGVTYTYSVWVKAKEGYAIANGAPLYINGSRVWNCNFSDYAPGEAPEGCFVSGTYAEVHSEKCVLANLKVNGIEVTTANRGDILGDADGAAATAYYDPATNTLTLDGAALTSTEEYYAVQSWDPEFKILLKGENTITGQGNAHAAVYSHNDLTITGSGSLATGGTAFGLYGNSTITVTGGASVNLVVDFPGEGADQPLSAVRALGGLTVDAASLFAINNGTRNEYFGAPGISTSLTAKNGAKVSILAANDAAITLDLVVSGKGTRVKAFSANPNYYGIATGADQTFIVSDEATVIAAGGLDGAMARKPDLTGYTDVRVRAGGTEDTAAEVADPENTDYQKNTYVSIGPKIGEILPKPDESIGLVQDTVMVEGEPTLALVSSASADDVTTAAQLVSSLQGESSQFEVYTADGVTKVADDKPVGTGCVVRWAGDTTGESDVVLVVMGDVDGDGASNSGDLLEIRRDLLEVTKLEGVYLKAGQVAANPGDKLKSDDLLQVRRFLLKVIDSYTE